MSQTQPRTAAGAQQMLTALNGLISQRNAGPADTTPRNTVYLDEANAALAPREATRLACRGRIDGWPYRTPDRNSDESAAAFRA
ncbi:hypothetical protein [Streptomyces sp. NRRL S-1868]|uniref:hypothetical protein n=1 Tax=Streptomyces sp. NRRL S-1868 TaxID=1463892 RepID=UPI0004C9DDD9|nr:hypothetical protein [Streptomyces sp. NRRL S-1868]